MRSVLASSVLAHLQQGTLSIWAGSVVGGEPGYAT